jgi:leucyl-tRNA---protein transferase
VIMLQEPRLAPSVSCPYLEGQTFVQEYFFATQLNEVEFDYYLTRGWRRFGIYFFRPRCSGCQACVPIRIDVEKLQLTSSQKRAVKKNRNTRVELKPLAFSEELFQIYSRHSLKFGEEERDRDSFRDSYFQNAVPAFQTEYILEGKTGAVGFLDVGSSGLSSVYYAYDPPFSSYSLGTFSVIKECELTRNAGLKWYYLGYYIADCPRMVYKGRFLPRQLYNWEKECWEDE